MSRFRKAVRTVGLTVVAQRLGETTQCVNNWVARGQVPVEKCREVERALDGQASLRDLRPRDWMRIWPELAEAERTAA